MSKCRHKPKLMVHGCAKIWSLRKPRPSKWFGMPLSSHPLPMPTNRFSTCGKNLGLPRLQKPGRSELSLTREASFKPLCLPAKCKGLNTKQKWGLRRHGPGNHPMRRLKPFPLGASRFRR